MDLPVETTPEQIAWEGHTGGNVDLLSDTMGVDFCPYLGDLVRKVRELWYRLVPEVARPPLQRKGRVSIEFSVLKNGTVDEMKITESSGDAALDRAAWGGILAATPFSPLPEHFPGNRLSLRFHFFYNRGGFAIWPSKPIVYSGLVRTVPVRIGTSERFTAMVNGKGGGHLLSWSRFACDLERLAAVVAKE